MPTGLRSDMKGIMSGARCAGSRVRLGFAHGKAWFTRWRMVWTLSSWSRPSLGRVRSFEADLPPATPWRCPRPSLQTGYRRAVKGLHPSAGRASQSSPGFSCKLTGAAGARLDMGSAPGCLRHPAGLLRATLRLLTGRYEGVTPHFLLSRAGSPFSARLAPRCGPGGCDKTRTATVGPWTVCPIASIAGARYGGP